VARGYREAGIAAIAVERASNKKLSVGKRCSATYVSLKACPPCPLWEVCYTKSGPISFTVAPLTDSGVTAPEDIARQEAAAIRTLTGTYPLRLHVSGDCKTAFAASIVAEAACEHSAKFGQGVWTYTHAWRVVERAAWEGVSVLASCETLADVEGAHARGYAPALVVTEHEKETAYPLGEGFTGIPCPQQTGRSASCVDCKLCFKADRLHAGKKVILFALHGANKSKAGDALER